jgi:hypothetical protein
MALLACSSGSRSHNTEQPAHVQKQRHIMKYLSLSLALAFLLTVSCDKDNRQDDSDADSQTKLPAGWHKAGDKPERYDMGVTDDAGARVATIKSRDSHINGFGTLMQNFLPDTFLGKRIRMRGRLKTRDASSAQFWLRVDKAGKTDPLAFDNMDDRPVTGTTGWKEYAIVLDVPEAASNIAFGAMLVGSGEIWFDKFQFDIVDTTVAITGSINYGQRQRSIRPVNLDFED